MPELDLNSDLGESWLPEVIGDDEARLALVSSASLACGAHGGDPATMAAACRSAVANGVAIGAHPSYDDREGFGRRDVDVDAATLLDQLREQVDRVAAEHGLPVLGLGASAIEHAAARAGVDFVVEAFVDRAYRPDGSPHRPCTPFRRKRRSTPRSAATRRRARRAAAIS